MTEDEAKTKWCPLARMMLPGDSPCSCIASHCMAWRWGTQDYETFEKPDGTVVYATSEQILNDAKEAGWPPRGYCGLAGYP